MRRNKKSILRRDCFASLPEPVLSDSEVVARPEPERFRARNDTIMKEGVFGRSQR
jgi:hypothetical protein